ncbi:MAG: MMPL family transporter [Bowdeniella nasicola]|nr:MMPL family transporter [Bowdeniella nasicola]
MSATLTRLPVRIVLILVWLVILAFGGMAQGKLSGVQENDQAAFLPADAESTRAGQAVETFIAGESLPILAVAHAPNGEFTDDKRSAVTAALAPLPQAPAVDPLTGETITLGELTDVSSLVSIPAEDGAALLIPFSLDTERADATWEDERGITIVVSAMREAIAALDLPEGVVVDVAGPGGYAADLVGAFGGVDLILLLVALGVVMVILLIVYRSPILPIAVLATDLFALCGAALIVYELAARDVLTLNGQSQGIMSILVIGATTDYALLLVARYREALVLHDSPHTAMRAALAGASPAIAASAATVIVGLLALLFSGLAGTRSLGPIAAAGIIFSLLAALTLLPALLLGLGSRSRALFWPAIPRISDTPASQHRLWGAVSRWVCGRDRAVWVVTALVLVALSGLAPTFRAEGTSDAAVLRTPSEAVRGNAALETHFAAGSAQPVRIVVSESVATEVAEQLSAVPGVQSVRPYIASDTAGPTGPPPGIDAGESDGPPPGVTNAGESGPPPGISTEGTGGPPPGVANGAGGELPPTVVEGRVLLNAVTEHLPDDPRSWDVVRDIRSEVRQLDSQGLVGGAAAAKLDTRETARADLWRVVPVTLVGITLMLVVLLRSLAAPLMLVVANGISFLATMGLAAAIFNHLLDLPGADPSVPLYAFVFLVALGIDYTIFLMTRVREEAHESPTPDALRRALESTGGVITSAGLVLAATFAVLVVIPLLFMLQLAVIVALGVLIDTFIVRTLLVSGITHDVGDPIWWPARSPSRGRHRL